MPTRLATTNDSSVIAELLGELREETVENSDITESLQQIVDSIDRDVILSYDETTGNITGLAVVNIVHKLPKREVRIDEVIVSSTVRGQGYGRTLMTACENWARAHHADTIELTSRPTRTAANHLYQKLNYRIRDTNVYHKKEGEF